MNWNRRFSRTRSSAWSSNASICSSASWSPCAWPCRRVAGHPQPAHAACTADLIREEIRPYLRDVFDHADAHQRLQPTRWANC